MPDRHRDFGAPADGRKAPVTFTLLGEEFTCLPEAPSGVLNDLVAGITFDPETGDRVFSAPNLVSFVVGVLRDEEAAPAELEDGSPFPDAPDGPLLAAEEAREMGFVVPNDVTKVVLVETDDVERFRRLVRDKRRVVPIDVLGALVMWLGEEMANRPTRPSARSGRGRR